MTIKEAINNRHSVRKYKAEEISEQVKHELQAEIGACNKEGTLRLQLITQDNKSFGGFFTHYGRFSNVTNFIVLSGKKNADLAEKIGYYGERVVIKAQMLGLNSCWVAATYDKKRCSGFLQEGEELLGVITLGYGISQGEPHKSKELKLVCNNILQGLPEWAQNGIKMALLAPTGMNKQNFMFTIDGKQIKLDTFDSDYYQLDKGILKYHFEVGAGMENFVWKK